MKQKDVLEEEICKVEPFQELEQETNTAKLQPKITFLWKNKPRSSWKSAGKARENKNTGVQKSSSSRDDPTKELVGS